MPYGQAVKNAVEYCIKQGVLEEFLKKYESEVVDMATWQYNPETAVRIAREEGREEGRNEGRDEGILATAKNMPCFKTASGTLVDYFDAFNAVFLFFPQFPSK